MNEKSTPETPRRPERVALANLAGSVGEFLLNDMALAGAAYERHGKAENPIAFERVDAPDEPPGFDAIVLALPAAEPLPEDLLASLSQTTAVYAACVCEKSAPEDALPLLSSLEQACDQHELVWRGGMAIGNAEVLLAFAHMPRLGFWRRPTSEGVDQLLFAIRCGQPAGRVPIRQGWLRLLRARLSS